MINKKQFNRLIKETIKDFEAMSDYKMAEDLKVILNYKNIKDATIEIVSPLIELIETTKLRPILHPVEYEIRKEHKKMEQYLRQFFNWRLTEDHMIIMNKKGA